MKKSLFLLAVSLLLAVAMIFGVSAAIADGDVGVYIRFDSQEKVDAYAKEENMFITFDAEHSALRWDNYFPGLDTTSTIDNILRAYFGEAVSVSEYPYMRVTYMRPTKDHYGDETNARNNFYVYLNQSISGSGITAAEGQSFPATVALPTNDYVRGDAWQRFVYDIKTPIEAKSGTHVVDVRFDLPNNTKSTDYPNNFIFYIYDIGFFKTAEAAMTYDHNNEYMIIDMTDPANAARWSVSGNGAAPFAYDSEQQATVFTHGKWVRAENLNDKGEPKNADARADLPLGALELFNPNVYPYAGMMVKSNVPTSDLFILHTVYTGEATSTLKGNLSNFGTISNVVYKSSSFQTNANWNQNLVAADCVDQWMYMTEDYTTVNAKYDFSTAVAVRNFRMDPINISESLEGKEYRAFKYIAHYKTAAEAALQAQLAPKTAIGVAPAAVDGKGSITGVDSTMEYRVAGTGAYTAVTGTVIENLDPGVTYDVRYAAKEGFNPGVPAEVSVPHYWKLEITGFKTADGEDITDASIVKNSNNSFDVTFQLGTNIAEIIPVYTYETSAPATYKNMVGNDAARSAFNLYQNLYIFDELVQIISGTTAIELTLGENVLHARQPKTLLEEVVINVEIEYGDFTDQEIAEKIVEDLSAKVVDPALLTSAADIDAAEAIVKAAINLDNVIAGYPGATATFNSVSISMAEAGTAADVDGTDGAYVYNIAVAYNDASAATEDITVVVPAKHFRILWKFNDQEFADQWKFAGSGINAESFVLTEDGKLPIITDGDKSYLHFETIKDLESVDAYYTYGTEYTTKPASGEYNTLFNTEDYPYFVIKSRDAGKKLPSTGGGHIYFETDWYVDNNNYDGKGYPGNPNEAAAAIPVEEHLNASYKGYAYAKSKALWTMNSNIFAPGKNTVIVDTTGGLGNVSFTSSGYYYNGETVNFNYGFVEFPWKGNVTYIRFPITKFNAITEGDWYDIEYIAFFATLEEAQAFTGEVAEPISAENKAAVDALAFTELDGLEIRTSADVEAAVSAEAAEGLADLGFEAIRANVTEFVAPDVADGTAGSAIVALTVTNGEYLGDRDVYTVTKNVAITAPESFVEVFNAMIPSFAEGGENAADVIYTEEKAKAHVDAALAELAATYNVEYTYVDAVFTAPADGVSAGSYVFKLAINGEETDEFTVYIAMGLKPIIYNFANDMMFSVTGKHDALTAQLADDANALGGKILRLERNLEEGETSTEFNISLYPGANGADAIADLSDYPVVAYRYKVSTASGKNQIYFYTDGYTGGGHAYYDVTTGNNGAVTADTWYNRIFNAGAIKNATTGTVNGDTTWNNTPSKIRFDFVRGFGTSATVELDYIGFFASVEQAEAFMAAPYMRGTESGLSKYADDLTTVNAATSATISSEEVTSGLAAAKAYVEKLNLENAAEAYCAVSEYVPAKAAVEDNPETEEDETAEATDGKIVFKVIFGENGYSNDYTIASEDVIITIEAPKADEPVVDGEEVNGVFYVKDEDASTATIINVAEGDSVVVPETVTIDEVEYAVTAIAADAFAGCTAAEVRLPNTITEAVVLTGYEGYVFVQPDTDTAAVVTGDCVKLKGDYNDDKTTEVGDVIKILQTLAGGAVEGYAQLACDVVASEGNLVDVSDVIKLLQWLASPTTVLD